MLSLNQVKFLHALSVKKYRLQHQKFVVEGEKMVAELLCQQRVAVLAVFGLEQWATDHASLLYPFLDKFQAVTAVELAKISSLSTPNAVLAVAEMPQGAPDISLPAYSWCFYLDGIQDPGNMGSILRVADWFGLPAVFCSPDCAEVYNPKVVQASMGAVFRVQTWEIPLSTLINKQNFAVAGAVLGGENVFEADLPANGLLVIGNEGRGIAPETSVLLTHRITIPKGPNGGAESLNAAVASGILAAIIAARG